jgi:hypothetical protein
LAKPARTNWQRLTTIGGIMILVGTEVFGVAVAGGWALAGLLDLGPTVQYLLIGLFSVLGAYIMLALWRKSISIEPISE